MTAVRILCTQPAVPEVELLEQALTDAGYVVHVSFGRLAVRDLEFERRNGEIVLIYWTPEAATQHYMLEWAARTHAERRIEVAVRCPHPPKIERFEPVIEFSDWRGQTDGRAWNVLQDRLRATVRAMTPAKAPSKQTVVVAVAVGAVMFGSAVGVRVQEGGGVVASNEDIAPPPSSSLASSTTNGWGGVIEEGSDLLEPPSADEVMGLSRTTPRVSFMAHYQPSTLTNVSAYQPVELRDPTLVQRIVESEFNVLGLGRRDRGGDRD